MKPASATHFTRDQVTDAFLTAQHADFTRTQVVRMLNQADKSVDGESLDYGDGYTIARTADGHYVIQVAGIWLCSAPDQGKD